MIWTDIMLRFAFSRDVLRDKRQAEMLCEQRKPDIMRSASCTSSFFIFFCSDPSNMVHLASKML